MIALLGWRLFKGELYAVDLESCRAIMFTIKGKQFGCGMRYNKQPIKLTGEQFDALISLTRINSDAIKSALRAHLVDGVTKAESARAFGVQRGLVTRRTQRIIEVAQAVRAVHIIGEEAL